MNELLVVQRDAYVVDASARDGKEHQIATLNVGSVNWGSHSIHVCRYTRQRNAVLLETI
jgi:hypothetical protein